MSGSAQDDNRIALVMLPGLDGTGRLFTPLLRELPADVEPVIISYPVDKALSYPQLVSYVENRIPEGRKVVILAESFSGPVAIGLAASGRREVSGLVLCSTFSRNPRPFLIRLLSMLPLPAIFGSWLPKTLVRMILLGGDAPDSLVEDLRFAVKSVRPWVLAQRLREVAGVDLSVPLKEMAVPVCALKGSSDVLVPDDALKVPEGAELHLIDGPHMLLQARASASASVMISFLKRLQEIPYSLKCRVISLSSSERPAR